MRLPAGQVRGCSVAMAKVCLLRCLACRCYPRDSTGCRGVCACTQQGKAVWGARGEGVRPTAVGPYVANCVFSTRALCFLPSPLLISAYPAPCLPSTGQIAQLFPNTSRRLPALPRGQLADVLAPSWPNCKGFGSTSPARVPGAGKACLVSILSRYKTRFEKPEPFHWQGVEAAGDVQLPQLRFPARPRSQRLSLHVLQTHAPRMHPQPASPGSACPQPRCCEHFRLCIPLFPAVTPGRSVPPTPQHEALHEGAGECKTDTCAELRWLLRGSPLLSCPNAGWGGGGGSGWHRERSFVPRRPRSAAGGVTHRRAVAGAAVTVRPQTGHGVGAACPRDTPRWGWGRSRPRSPRCRRLNFPARFPTPSSRRTPHVCHLTATRGSAGGGGGDSAGRLGPGPVSHPEGPPSPRSPPTPNRAVPGSLEEADPICVPIPGAAPRRSEQLSGLRRRTTQGES